jgi:UDP-glucose 4-epimerase
MEQILKSISGKRVLITGGGGYLGSMLANDLKIANIELFLTDKNFSSKIREMFLDSNNINFLNADLTDYDQINDACKIANPDIIFHFGAILNRERDFKLYDTLYNINVKGTLNLLQALLPYNYSHFIFSSSSEVYGSLNLSPFNENQIPLPSSPYSLTKLMAENLIKTFSELNIKPYTILRIFNFYGIDMPENFFISQLETALINNKPFEMTKGEQIRDFLEITELINIIIKLLNCSINKEIINICSGKGVKINELAINIAKQQQKEHFLQIGSLPYRENEIWEMIGDNKKLSTFLINKI